MEKNHPYGRHLRFFQNGGRLPYFQQFHLVPFFSPYCPLHIPTAKLRPACNVYGGVWQALDHTARLRSAHKPDAHVTLVCPRVCRNYGEGGFSFAGPAAWNALSLETRSATSLEQFKSKLKTELFTISYP